MHGEMRKACAVVVKKPYGKRTLRRPTRVSVRYFPDYKHYRLYVAPQKSFSHG